jgi:hypothetical protein
MPCYVVDAIHDIPAYAEPEWEEDGFGFGFDLDEFDP